MNYKKIISTIFSTITVCFMFLSLFAINNISISPLKANAYETLYPEKAIPSVHWEYTYSDSSYADVKVDWQDCKNIADPYYCQIFKKGASEEEMPFRQELPEESYAEFYRVPAGEYYVKVVSCNHFDLTVTCSDPVYFTIPERPVTTTTSTLTTTTTMTTTSLALPDLKVDNTNIMLKNGEQYTLSANLKDVTYKSNNTNVAVVSSSGIITALGEGNATISVIDSNSNVVQVKVTVIPITTEDTETTTRTTSEEIYITTTAIADYENKNISTGDINSDGDINLKDVVILRRYIAGGWGVTLDEKTADINNDGDVNLKDVVILRRYIAGGWGVILNNDKTETPFTLNKSELTLNTEGESKTYQLKVNGIDPENIDWSSSDSSIAAVSTRGLVVAFKDGTVTINATINNSTVSCKVIVKTSYDKTFSEWSDWTTTPIESSDTVEVKTEERSSQVLVSHNIAYYCTVKLNPWRRQFRNYSVNPADIGNDPIYGENTTLSAFKVPYLVKTVEELNAVEKIQPGEWSTGSQYGQNCADVVGYSFDGCIFYIIGDNYETTSTTYYSSRTITKTPVEYQN